jgi:hypothetical protein
LADVRVIDNNNKETPFKIVSGRREDKKTDYSATMINNSFVPGQFSTVILDLGDKGKIVNNLNIVTSSENFQRSVHVQGSDDMNSWNTLKENIYIYDYTDRKGNLKVQNTKISFPDSLFRYLKIEISDENNNPVKIDAVRASQTISTSQREFERHPQFSVFEDADSRSTEIIADLGKAGMPTNKLLLTASDANFNRAIIIYSSNDKSNWKMIGQGYIFRYNTSKFSGENMTVSYSETNNQYLKIQIINKDNMPLTFSGLSVYSVYRELIFPADKNSQYRLFYGNNDAYYPEYDLDKYFQYLDVENAQTALLSARKDNNQFVPKKEPEKPISEKIPYLLPGVLITVSMLLIIFVYRFLKK